MQEEVVSPLATFVGCHQIIPVLMLNILVFLLELTLDHLQC